MKVREMLFSLVAAHKACKNEAVKKALKEAIVVLQDVYLNMSGTIGLEIELSKSRGDRLVVSFDYDHMDEAGYRMGETSYRAVITPRLVDVKGFNKDGARDYLTDTLKLALDEDC